MIQKEEINFRLVIFHSTNEEKKAFLELEQVLIGIIILPNYSILSAFLFDVYTLKNSINIWEE